MMKKIMMFFLSAILLLGFSGQALATFGDGDLIRVVYSSAGTMETGTDLGSIVNLTGPTGQNINFNAPAFSLSALGAGATAANSYVAYFSLTLTPNPKNQAWVSGPDSGQTASKANFQNYVGKTHNTNAFYDQVSNQGFQVTVLMSDPNSFWNQLTAAGGGVGKMGGFIPAGNAVASLAGLETQGYVDQMLYYYGSPSGVGTNTTGVNVAVIRTYADGHTELNPVVVAPGVTVVSPNGDETINAGASFNIQWTAVGSAVQFGIEYSTDNGTTWNAASQGMVTGTSYQWTVPTPQTSQTQSLVRVVGYDAVGAQVATDTSDNTFTIQVVATGVTVVSPNGGEVLGAGASQNIQWTASGSAVTFKVDYSTDNGATWHDVTTGTLAGTSYQWTVPTLTATSTTSLVRVVGFDSGAAQVATDVSDAAFTIQAAPREVTVVSPNGGELLGAGQVYTVQWTAAPAAVAFWVHYSSDNGATWIPLTKGKISGTTYQWVLPTPDMNLRQCRVRVAGYDASGARVGLDKSDRLFTIEVIKVTSPDSAQNIAPGTPYNITWRTNGTGAPVAKVAIWYHHDGVKKLVKQMPGNPGSYVWTPNGADVSTQGRIQVLLRDAAGNLVGSDLSDHFFSVQ